MWNGRRLCNISLLHHPPGFTLCYCILHSDCDVSRTRMSSLSVSNYSSEVLYSLCAWHNGQFISFKLFNRKERGDSVRGLLLDLESETDMRSTHGKISVAKRRCSRKKRLKLTLRLVFSHMQSISILLFIVSSHDLKTFKDNPGVLQLICSLQIT